jgi:hypothetical protein
MTALLPFRIIWPRWCYQDEVYFALLDGAPDLNPIISHAGSEVWWRAVERPSRFGPSRVLHRDGDEPAFVDGVSGMRIWCRDGKPHRLTGPAIIQPHAEPHESWFLDGIEITADVERWIADQEMPPWGEWTDSEHVLFRIGFMAERIGA